MPFSNSDISPNADALTATSALGFDTTVISGSPPQIAEYGLSPETMHSWLRELLLVPQWRRQVDQDHDLNEANQLSPEVATEMRNRGQAPAQAPLVSSRIDAILGAEAQTRTGVRVDTAPGEATPEVAEALTVKLFHAIADTDADAAIAAAYRGQVVGGVDWVEVSRDDDPFKPRIKVKYVPYHEMFWDWRSKDFALLSDARYLIRKKRLDWDIILTKWPEIGPVIQSLLGNGNRFQAWDFSQFGIAMTRGLEVNRGLREEEFEWFSPQRKTSLVYEVWYKQMTPVEIFYRPDGTAVEFDPNDEVHVELRNRGIIVPESRHTLKMRCSIWVGNIRVADNPTPYPHNEFPYTPFFGFRETRYGTPYGMVRRLTSLQELINNTLSKIHFHMASSQLFYDKRAFEDPKAVMKMLNRSNFAIAVESDPLTGQLYNVDYKRGSQLIDPHINYLSTLMTMFDAVSGIHAATLGNQSGEMAASAVNIAREQDQTGLASLNDNYRRARKKVHELLLELVKEDLSTQQNVKVEVMRDIGGPRTVTLNAQKQLEDGSWVTENNVSDVNVRVVLESTPKSDTYQQAQMVAVSEMLKSSPEDVQRMLWPSIIRLASGVPGNQRIADILAQNVGLTDANGDLQNPKIKQLEEQVQQLQTQLEAKKPQALIDAEVAKLSAQTNEIEKNMAKTVAETMKLTLESFFSSIQTASLVAQNPSIAPVSDRIMQGAGFQRSEVGQDPDILPPGQEAQMPPMQQATVLPPNFHPNLPAAPAAPTSPVPAMAQPAAPVEPDVGVEKGIEGGQQ
jgi:hypothetical protein